MKDNYRRIDFPAGKSIEEIVKDLQNYNTKKEKVSAEFNGKILYSDTVTLENAYMQITGMSIEDFEKLKKTEMEEHEDRQEFKRYFGYNLELYTKLLPLRKDEKLSWKEIYELKWESIDLENGTINIPCSE